MPLEEASSVPLGPGALSYETATAYGKDCLIGTMSVDPLLSVSILPSRCWVAFLIPIAWSGDFTFNGQLASPYDVFFSSRRYGYTTVGQKRNNIHLGFRTTTLVEAIAAHRGVGQEDVVLDDFRLPLKPQEGKRVQRLAMEAIIDSRFFHADHQTLALPPDRERDFISAFAGLISGRVLGVEAEYTPSLRSLEIVRLAEEAWGQKTTTASIAEMCQASGVSERWLRKSFHDVFGISPNQYIKNRRLNDARNLLLDEECKPRSVKEVALSLGFWGSGRFAQEYRALFDELPSTTFARNQ